MVKEELNDPTTHRTVMAPHHCYNGHHVLCVTAYSIDRKYNGSQTS